MTPDRAIETAADYADAMMCARSAKNLLVLVLLLMLLVQLTIFFIARYKPDVIGTAVGATASTKQVDASTNESTVAPAPSKTTALLRYLTGLIDFLGVAFAIVLAFALFLIVQVMLVGRLIGVSRLTSAFLWCIVLIVLLFPWQGFLMHADFKPPGILFTWDELVVGARFGIDSQADVFQLILKWSRFVVLPFVAIVILLTIQVKSNRGLRQALGEGDASASAA